MNVRPPKKEREVVQAAVNRMLADEPPGLPISVDAERRLEALMPDGWEWVSHTSRGGPPRILITRT